MWRAGAFEDSRMDSKNFNKKSSTCAQVSNLLDKGELFTTQRHGTTREAPNVSGSWLEDAAPQSILAPKFGATGKGKINKSSLLEILGVADLSTYDLLDSGVF